MEVSVAPGGEDAMLSSVSVRTDWALGGLAAALATVVAAAALLVSPRYFFTDDYTTQFIPVFREIARLVGQGHFPLITDRIWQGGALVQEYQYAVFNPFSMILYLILTPLDDLRAFAAIFSLIHIFILAAGAYFVCRVLGAARRHAFLAAVLAPLSNWIFFWGATDWIPGLVSMAWQVWAWGLLILTFRRPSFAPAAAIAVALTITSGWPFADLALLVSVLVGARVLIASNPRDHIRSAVWVALALAAGGLLAAPAVVPLELYTQYVARPAVDGLWGTDLTGLLEFGMPFVQVTWGNFNGEFVPVRQPIVFVAWFAPLVLASANWKRLLQSRAVWVIVGSALAFAALSMISHIGLLRWMFRLLPYYQFAILVLVALALTRADEEGQTWNFDRMALVIAVEVWLAFSQTRSLAFAYVGVGYAFGVLAWITLRFKRRRDVRWTALAVVSSIAMFWLTAWVTAIGGYPRYPQKWTPPANPAAQAQLNGPSVTQYALVHQLTQQADPGAAYWTTFRPLNIALEQPGSGIVGYSSMVTQSYGQLICQTVARMPCGVLVQHLTAPVRPTGLSLIDLMGVDRVVIQNPADAAKFGAWAGPGWKQSRGPAGEWRFDRIRPIGLVSWVSPGVTTRIVSRDPARVAADVRNDAPAKGEVVLARAWYPGWSARLNGAPVRAQPLAGLLVSVDLPPHSQGRLEVTFWPAGLTAGLVLAALGVLLIALAALFPRLVDGPASRLSQVSMGFWKKPQASSA